MTDAGGRERRRAPSRSAWRTAGAALLVLACGPGATPESDGAAAAPSGAAPSTGSDTSPTAMSDRTDSLLVLLEAPDAVPAGDPIPFTLRVENRSDAPLTLYLTGREITFDVVVRTEAGETVWRRLEGEVIPAVLRVETLDAGGERVLEATWDQRTATGAAVPPGRYRVHGELLAEGDPLRSPPIEIRILAP